MTAASMHKCLSLSAKDEEDFAVISALLQDAEVKLRDMTFVRDESKFIVLANRFVRESNMENVYQSGTMNRVPTGLCFDGVKSVQTRDIIREDRDTRLRFLSVSYVQEEVALIFSGGGAIKLKGDNMICLFRDLDAEPDEGETSV